MVENVLADCIGMLPSAIDCANRSANGTHKGIKGI